MNLGEEEELVAQEWLRTRKIVASTQWLGKWDPAGVPRCKLTEDGGEMVPVPDFLATTTAGAELWVEVKSTPRIGNLQLENYYRIARAQPHRSFFLLFVYKQQSESGGLWRLNVVQLNKLKRRWGPRTEPWKDDYWLIDKACMGEGHVMTWTVPETQTATNG